MVVSDQAAMSTSSNGDGTPMQSENGRVPNDSEDIAGSPETASVIPQSLASKLLLARESSLPEPPSENPPKPTRLASLLVVGGQNVGKTSLVQYFVKRDYQGNTLSCESPSDPDWSVAYSKKDFSFWKKPGKMRCTRVQLWDLSCGGPQKPLSKPRECKLLLEKSSTIILVGTLEGEGPPAEVWESFAAYVRAWKDWLDSIAKRRVVLFVSKADVAAMPDVFDLPSRLGSLCESCDIDDWFATSVTAEDNGAYLSSVDHAFVSVLRKDTGAKSMSEARSIATSRSLQSRSILSSPITIGSVPSQL